MQDSTRQQPPARNAENVHATIEAFALRHNFVKKLPGGAYIYPIPDNDAQMAGFLEAVREISDSQGVLESESSNKAQQLLSELTANRVKVDSEFKQAFIKAYSDSLNKEMQERSTQPPQFESLEQPGKTPDSQNKSEMVDAEELNPIAVIDEANTANPRSRAELQAYVDRLSALSDEAVIKASVEQGRYPLAEVEIRDLLKEGYEVEIHLDEQKERTKELAPVVDDILRAVGSDSFTGKNYSAERDADNGHLKLTRRGDEVAIMEAKPTASGWQPILPRTISQDYKEFLTSEDVTKVKEARQQIQRWQENRSQSPTKRQEIER